MTRWLAATALIVAVASAPRAAHACGGFFCNNVPIDQSGERVLFAVNDGVVTAHIQIIYKGAAEKFAWVLPIPAIPTVNVGTDALFNALGNRTQPSFQVEWQYNDGCYFYGGGGFAEDADGGPPNAGGGPKSGGVEVVAAGEVGPYDYKVIQGTSDDSGEAVFQWLQDNGYDQPDIAKDLVTTYVAEHHVFVAVKLLKDADVGSIQPLVLNYPLPAGCVPLRLTSIAATEDMDVWVYMLGQSRAVPVNFFHVEVSEPHIDWINYGSNYKEVARKAIDSAAGRGFLTEFAGDTNDMKGVIWSPGKFDVSTLETKTTPWEFYQALLNWVNYGFPVTGQTRTLLRKYIPMPQALKDQQMNEQQFYNSLQQYKDQLAPFDPKAFAAELDELVLKPMEEASKLFDEYRYMTRLYTVISPSEMVRDPIFQFNPDLPNVSNVHKATGHAICAPGKNEPEKVIVTLSDGTELSYKGPFYDYQNPPVLEGADAFGGEAKAVERMYTAGPPEAVKAVDVPKVEKEFDKITVGLIVSETPNGGKPVTTTHPGTGTDSGSCAAGSGTPWTGIALLGLALFAAAALLRRRARE